jgi:hypothetical protein
MNEIIDSIRVETHTLRWTDEEDPEKTFLANIAFLDTEEQGHEMSEGIMDNDPEWIDFDERILYWITAFQGEKIEEHYPNENPRMDFFVIPDEEV